MIFLHVFIVNRDCSDIQTSTQSTVFYLFINSAQCHEIGETRPNHLAQEKVPVISILFVKSVAIL